MKIAVDVMGGDHAPHEIILGAIKKAKQTDSELILVGDESTIQKELERYVVRLNNISIVHSNEVVEMQESATVALRKKKDSSIVVANQLVKEGKADAVVSCGNTGAQMAAAIFILGRLKDIDRPPIIASVPTINGEDSFLIDVGANVDCKPKQLLQFALLGQVYSSLIKGKSDPTIALLNNGEEEGKGNNQLIETYELFKKQKDLNFIGNIEGRNIFNGKSNVIVCDGFIGNVLLKTIEEMAIMMTDLFKQENNKLPEFLERLDYTKVGGAPLLGIDGISIVGHGSSKREAVFNAIGIAEDCIKKEVVKIQNLALDNSI
ncbi:Phosphate:acyl-ACP acyltransferase PlsX [Candidatus Syntrophocurvum alkaliphilum]|uniref:Phosphate acyltransferase n=1 Tax=Candidatus Syntrophocurvum alkaliphilum TaxID=2293317 RepID=A0A6I6D7I1_9FIRM|nr:phosphate acyltransferase PlsX [Candidatus Syntrophocurvum alkaliphilum]QGT99086.1 Phosphate:acyl-ACP acyltransferase PlsX [Candidatus Syntrophocurvum alkaliphilum]